VVKQLEATLEPATFDHLVQLFISRLPLIKTDADLRAAGQATADLLSRAWRNARHAFFPTIEPVFLFQAISQRPSLPPLTD
jgi:hypothetical protein